MNKRVNTIDVLTHQTPARRDAPFTVQGRRELDRRGARSQAVETINRSKTQQGILSTVLLNG
jgi:hypothetical protein